MNTWRECLIEALRQHGESFSDVISASITDAELDGKIHGAGLNLWFKEFTAYTTARVYYPVASMDTNGVSVDSQSRNPITLLRTK